MKLVCLFISAFICILTLVPATAVEYGYYEYHASENLNDIDGASDQSIWAVGDNGLILHYDGSSWQEEQSRTTVDLISVAAIDKTHAYVVGGTSSSNAVCLYHNGNGWQEIAEISGGTKVDCLPSGEVWVLDFSGNVHYFNGTSWSTMGLTVKGTVQSFSVIDSDHIWLQSYKADFKTDYQNPYNFYVYQYVSGDLSEYSIYSGVDYLVKCDIFAWDSQNVWMAYDLHGTPPFTQYSTLAFFDGTDWQSLDWTWGEEFTKVRCKDLNRVYTVAESGVYQVQGNQLNLLESSIEAVTGIYVGEDGNWWTVEGDSIIHYRDWPVGQQPVGTKVVLKSSSGPHVGPVMYCYYITGCVQPTSDIFDLYVLAMTPGGDIYSILSGGRVKHGINPYATSVNGLSTPVQATVYNVYLETRPPSGSYKTGIYVMPVGQKFNLQSALGSDTCDLSI